jgi:hypothetical protein
MVRVWMLAGALLSTSAWAGPFDGTWTIDHDQSEHMFEMPKDSWARSMVERFRGEPPEVFVTIVEGKDTVSMTVRHEEHVKERRARLDGVTRSLEGPLGFLFEETHTRDAEGNLVAHFATPLHDIDVTLRSDPSDPDTVRVEISLDDGEHKGLRVLRRVK